jgi:hypothetical protein
MPNRGRTAALGAVAVVIAGLVGAFGSSTGAQSDPVVVERISVGDDSLPQDLPEGVTVAMSDTGGVVAYERAVEADGEPSAEPALEPQVWIRDRVADTARGVVDVPSIAPGISGNGCVVAYSALGIDGDAATSSLTIVDRCATGPDVPLPIGTVLDTVAYPEGSPGASSPALSFDGSTVVWSTGREIRRYERPAVPSVATPADYELTDSFDSTATPVPEVVTGVDVDVSADGDTVVFLAGPGSVPYAPAPSNVYAWSRASSDDGPRLLSSTSSATPSAGESASPSISADGAFVVFESSATDLAVSADADVEAPYVVGVDLAATTARVVVADASRPALSDDGRHIAYVRGEAVRILTADGADPVDLAPEALASARPDGRLAISQFGRWVMFASSADLGPPVHDGPSIWAADLASSDPSPVDTTTTTTLPTGEKPSTTPPSTSTPSTTSTSTIAPDPESTTTTVTTQPPVVTVPPFPSSTGSSVVLPRFPRSSTSGSSGGSFRTTTSVPSASVAPVVFEPTVAGVGRRTLPVTMTSTSASTFTVNGVSLDPVGPFSIVTDGCTGTALVPGGSCSVEVQFVPVEVGQASATMTFVLPAGTVITTTVGGEGAPDPTLDLVPAVAGAGQTVTVFGAGFPPGATVDFVQPGVAVAEPLVVDPDGTFAHVVVVLPHTPTGPVTLSVSGQPNLFDDVVAELLVSSRGTSSDDAALRTGFGSSIAR